MFESFESYLSASRNTLQGMVDASLQVAVNAAAQGLIHAATQRLPILVCGNGGSAADAQHIAGELAGRFLLERPAIDVRALSADTALLTALGNDYGYETIFARQVQAHGRAGGVLLAISTSGKSRNVLLAAETARKQKMMVIGLTGEGGGPLAALSDVVLAVPSKSTPLVQQGHQVIYHYLCAVTELAMANLSND
jgi:D-sedoheptulose 7-phosphate isomerase